MNVIPARIAGVKEIAVVTPPNQNGGGKSHRAAGYADAHPLDRRVSLAQHHAGPVRQAEVPVDLCLMEVPDIVRRLPQRLPEILVHTVPGGAQLLRRHLKPLQICAVEPAGVFPQGPIPPGADVRQNGGHRRIHVLLRLGGAVKEGQVLQAVRLIDGNHASVTSFSLPRSASISWCLNW